MNCCLFLFGFGFGKSETRFIHCSIPTPTIPRRKWWRWWRILARWRSNSSFIRSCGSRFMNFIWQNRDRIASLSSWLSSLSIFSSFPLCYSFSCFNHFLAWQSIRLSFSWCRIHYWSPTSSSLSRWFVWSRFGGGDDFVDLWILIRSLCFVAVSRSLFLILCIFFILFFVSFLRLRGFLLLFLFFSFRIYLEMLHFLQSAPLLLLQLRDM